ncbi:hypothetical protein [Pigmentiphaga litoralis]|uniref:NADH:ubiquinone oxidoreductase subunit 6 (Subunit J) n=1 Tax=Pigmentiphaga litoralis TaxID=516702 RepID=A0A7Y9IXJ1_9BURK|nr:hypothetical protein [Pigmentiphaga litoralis]NYE25684.1 NADH:ubiquinone oxidoreductase subunit 6 (subunit J) [Pigmentiphaga litoralis]NYE84804.1 NADH:ubiquinone oxidoreductase subunit 6 (subunit J) [Pigmentiphaga litoralis]
MVLVRLLVVLLAVAVGLLIVAGFVTGNRKYYQRAWKLGRIGIAVALVFFGVLFVSRLMD